MAQAALGAHVGFAGLDDALEVRQAAGTVVGVEVALEDVLAQQVVRLVAEDVLDRRRVVDHDPIGSDDAGEVLGVFDERAEFVLAAAGGGLGVFALGNELAQVAVEQREFGGAFAHALFEFLVRVLEGFLRAAAVGDVLDRAFVAQQETLAVADGAGVFGDPDARAIGSEDLAFQVRDGAFRRQPLLELGPFGWTDVEQAEVRHDRHQRFWRRVAELVRERRVDAQKPAAGPGLVNALDGILEDAPVAGLGLDERGGALGNARFQLVAGGAQGLVGALAGFEFGQTALGVAPLLDLRHHQLGQFFENPDVVRPEIVARVAVDDAEGAEPVALRRGQRRAGVEADVRRTGHQREISEAFVERGVGHDEGAIFQDGVGADGSVARGVIVVDADTGFVPLAFAVEQGDERDGSLEDARGQEGDAVERGLGRGVHDAVASQLFQAVFLVSWQRSRHRTFTP